MSDASVAAWAHAEETLYAPLLADPQAYERVVRLVGALAAHLRENVSDIAGLVSAAGRGSALVAEVAPDAALPWMPLDDALQAACAMRYRELRVTVERTNRAATLREAAESGATWVRIVDPTSTVAARVAPALIVHVRSGMAVRCTTELDLETGGARFVATPVMVDPTSGDVVGPLTSVGPQRSAGSPDARDADVKSLQRLIEGA